MNERTWTVLELLRWTTEYFQRHGIEIPWPIQTQYEREWKEPDINEKVAEGEKVSDVKPPFWVRVVQFVIGVLSGW